MENWKLEDMKYKQFSFPFCPFSREGKRIKIMWTLIDSIYSSRVFIRHWYHYMALNGNFILKMFLLYRRWPGAWKLLSHFVSRWHIMTLTSSLSLVTFSISISIHQPHDVLQPLHGLLQLKWLDTNISTSRVQDIFAIYVTALSLSMYTFYTWGFLSTPTSLWYSSLHL